MVRAWPWVAASSMSLMLLGCPGLKKKAADAGPDAEAADAMATAADGGATLTAANESEVTRYPDETPIANVSATLHWSVTDARTQASHAGGAIVAALKSGTSVQKIAERQGFFLVVFSDPRDATRSEEGWVAEAAFEPEPPHKHVAVKCTSGEVAVLLQMGAEQCVTQCTSDSACPSGEGCSGAAPMSNNGAPGGIVSFCRSAKGGGAAPHGDAGTAPAAADAGGSAQNAFVCVKQNPPGHCPAGFVVSQALCRMPCSSAADCKGPSPKCNEGKCYNSNGCGP